MRAFRSIVLLGFLLELAAPRALPQSAGIFTIAGSGPIGFAGDGGLATSARLSFPASVATDAAGNMFIADSGNLRIRKVTPDGIISTIAGIGTPGIAIDAVGNLFIADTANLSIRKLTPDGTFSTVAGSGIGGFGGDGGPATAAQMYKPFGVAVDAGGNLYIINEGTLRVRKVTPDGIISTVAGNGTVGSSGDGGPATAAQLGQPSGIATDGFGNLFIADGFNSRVRKVTPAGIISTVAGNSPLTGNSVGGFGGDGGPATAAQLNRPTGLAVDAVGNLFIADTGNQRIRKVTPAGIISTIAGNGTSGFSGDGGPAVSAQLSLPQGLTVDSKGNLLIADRNNARVRKVAFAPPTLLTLSPDRGTQGTTVSVTLTGTNFIPAATRISVTGTGLFVNQVVAQNGTSLTASFTIPMDAAAGQRRVTVSTADGTSGSLTFSVNPDPLSPPSPSVTTIDTYAGSDRPASGTQATSYGIGRPLSVTPDGTGGFYFGAETAVYQVSSDGILQLIAGNPYRLGGSSGDGGPALEAQISPLSLARDSLGVLYIGDGERVRKISGDGVISTVASNLSLLRSVTVDAAGILYVSQENQIRKITPSGSLSVIAGTGVAGFGGDDGPATSAQIFSKGIALDSTGNLYIADYGNHRVRKVSANGVISTIAGTGTRGSSGDGGPATAAQLEFPGSVALDAAGNLYVAEAGCRTRKIASNGVINTIVGSGDCRGFGGDGGPAAAARLSYLYGAITVDDAANLYIADENNFRVRKVTSAGVIYTVAGNGYTLFSGDGGPAIRAQLAYPSGVAADAGGNLYVVDRANGRVRKVTPGGVISTVAGGVIAQGLPTPSYLDSPNDVAVDAAGNLYIAAGSRVHKVTGTGLISIIAGSGIFSPREGIAANSVNFYEPQGIAIDGAGNLYITDWNQVWKVTPDGVIHAFAGAGGEGYSGDGGPATAAQLRNPAGLSTDAMGNVYIADTGNGRIRKVAADGTISTVAGGENTTFYARHIAADPAGNLYIADQDGHRILKVSANGSISTVAGNGTPGFSGDGGPPASAELAYPSALAVDTAGNLFISDTNNQRIRKVSFVQRITYSIASRGAVSSRSSGMLNSAAAGYASIQPKAGTAMPAGFAIFGFRQNGVLVTEAGVPASPLIQSGRIYAEVNGPVNTGIAIANPNNQTATVSFYFTDLEGNNFGSGSTVIAANGQIAKFLDQLLFNGGSSLSGTFTFSSSVPIAVIAIRGLTNERSEFLITTLPVLDLSAPQASGPAIFPDFVEGGGWTSQIILVNPGDTMLSGTVQFLDQSGANAPINVNGQINSNIVYSIPARTSQKFQTSSSRVSTMSGTVRVMPSGNAAAPAGVAIFSDRNADTTVTEAGVPAQPAANAFRLYVEASGVLGAAGSIQTGFAIMNTSSLPATVTLELSKLDGSSTGLTGTISLPPDAQTARFLDQAFASLQLPFQGVLRVSSTALISVLGLRGRYNERGDFLITTTSPSNEAAVPSTAGLYFPHIVDGGGCTTQFVLFDGQADQLSAGTMRFFSQSGGAWSATLQ